MSGRWHTTVLAASSSAGHSSAAHEAAAATVPIANDSQQPLADLEVLFPLASDAADGAVDDSSSATEPPARHQETDEASALATLYDTSNSSSAAAGPDGDDDSDDSDECFPERFASWDHLEEYIREFSAHAYQVFRIRSTVSVRARNANLEKLAVPKTPLFPDAWEFYSKTYTCAYGPRHAPSARRHQQQQQQLTAGASSASSSPVTGRVTSCTARINASVTLDKTTHAYYVRAVVRGWHNHAVNRAQYYALAENRRIVDPALVALIARLDARGERPRAIFATVAQHVQQTTGAASPFQLQDVRNVLRIQSDERKKRSAAAAALDGSERAHPSTPAHGSDNEDEGDQGGESRAAVRAKGSRKRPFHATTPPLVAPPDAVDALPRSLVPVHEQLTLARLEMLLDSGFCYALSHHYVDRMAVAAVETLPRGVTKFRLRVVALPPAFQCTDVAFVLPKYAVDSCETRVIETCRRYERFPASVGVVLTVQPLASASTVSGGALASASPFGAVTLTAHQVKVMKRYYAARDLMRHVERVVDWLRSVRIASRPACAPFDDCVDRPKDFFTFPLSAMTLSTVTVSGVSTSVSGSVRFADAIYAPSVLKLAGAAGSSTPAALVNVDADCVKAVLLHMHARFHASGCFVSPSFIDAARQSLERRRIATLYGAFLSPKQFIAGVVQLPTTQRWGGFVYNYATKVSHVFAADASDYSELESVVRELWHDFSVVHAAFERFPACPAPLAAAAAAAPMAAGDTGVLALLAVELLLYAKTWTDVAIESLEYVRSRYLLQAVQVVNKQDVHALS